MFLETANAKFVNTLVLTSTEWHVILKGFAKGTSPTQHESRAVNETAEATATVRAPVCTDTIMSLEWIVQAPYILPLYMYNNI